MIKDRDRINWKKLLEKNLGEEEILAINVNKVLYKKKNLNIALNILEGTEWVHMFYVWTKDRIYYIGEYDGSEWLESISKKPQEDSVMIIHN